MGKPRATLILTCMRNVVVYSDRACPLVVVEVSDDLNRYRSDIVGKRLDLGESLWRDRVCAGVLQSVQARLEHN